MSPAERERYQLEVLSIVAEVCRQRGACTSAEIDERLAGLAAEQNWKETEWALCCLAADGLLEQGSVNQVRDWARVDARLGLVHGHPPRRRRMSPLGV